MTHPTYLASITADQHPGRILLYWRAYEADDAVCEGEIYGHYQEPCTAECSHADHVEAGQIPEDVATGTPCDEDAVAQTIRMAWGQSPWDLIWAYEIRDVGSRETTYAASMEDAVEEAEDWLRDGDWDTSEGTVYADAWVTCLATGEQEIVTVTIDQEEPPCPSEEDEHDWQSPVEIVGGIAENPGVWGHGGGVIIHECCMRCGCRRTTDTWAQRRDTGEQGLREVTYEVGYYDLSDRDA